MSAEIKAQGGLNAFLDANGDIAANFIGMVTWLLVPPHSAQKAGRIMGSCVPGPGDPNPGGAGTGSRGSSGNQ